MKVEFSINVEDETETAEELAVSFANAYIRTDTLDLLTILVDDKEIELELVDGKYALISFNVGY